MEKKKMETSKKVVWASYFSAILLTIVVIVGTFMNFEMSNVTTICSLSWAEVAGVNIFYLKKSAKENVPKVIASLPKEFQDQIDVNQLLNQ
jgi:hypothetical protein